MLNLSQETLQVLSASRCHHSNRPPTGMPASTQGPPWQRGVSLLPPPLMPADPTHPRLLRCHSDPLFREEGWREKGRGQSKTADHTGQKAARTSLPLLSVSHPLLSSPPPPSFLTPAIWVPVSTVTAMSHLHR